MYNIEQMKNRLESPVVTDNDLVNFVQNPGQVPSYLALAELQRRQDIRQSAPVNQGPQAPVAQQLIEQVSNQGINALSPQGGDVPPMMMADSGVANLPVDPGMFQEKSFAGGGIVAFDGGGEIRSYAGNSNDGSYVLPADYDPEEYAKKRYYQAKRLKDMYEQTKTPLSLSSVFTGDLGKRFGEISAFKDASKALKERTNTPYDPAIMFYKNKLADAPDDKYLSGAISTLGKQKENWLNTSAASLPQPRVDTPAAPEENIPVSLPEAMAIESGPQDYYDAFKTRQDSAGLGSIAPNKLKYDKNRFLGDLEDETGLAEKGMERYSTMAGENEFAKSIEAANKKKQAKLEDLERTNTGYGLVRAAEKLLKVRQGQEGVGMGEALGAFTDEYQKGLDKIETLQDKIDNNNLQLGKDKRDERRAAMNYGFDNEKTVKASNKALKTAQKGYEFDVEKSNVLTDLEVMKEKGAFGRAKLSADASLTNAMISAAKKSDKETFYSLAAQDPANTKVVTDPNTGKKTRVLDVVKIESMLRSLTPDIKNYSSYLKGEYAMSGIPPGLNEQQFQEYISGKGAGGASPGSRPPIQSFNK